MSLARKDYFPDLTVIGGVMPRGGAFEPMWQAGVSMPIPLWAGSKQSQAVTEYRLRGQASESGAEIIRRLARQRLEERRAMLTALLETNHLYRTGVLIQSEATVASAMAQYKVGRVPFAAVLEALSGYLTDLVGFYESVAATQRIDIAQRELSLDPVAGPSLGGPGGASMPGSSGMGAASAPAGSAPPRPPRDPPRRPCRRCSPEEIVKNEHSELETNAGAATKPAQLRPTTRLVSMAAALLVAGVALGVGATWLAMHQSGGPRASATATAEKPLYQCPMHPTITSDHPGECPICGMKLVEVRGEAKAAAVAGTGERKLLFYRSPMDPNQTSPTPRKDDMGMDYLPVYQDEAQGGGPSVDGLATVTIDPARQQLIGLQIAPVTRGSVSGSWRTVGRVEVDPTRVRKTNVKVEGYIERLYVDFVGRPVLRGQPLFSLYSPSLLAAENEYVLALQTRDALTRAGSTDGNGASLVEGSRRKLELWDVPAEEIRRLEQTRTPSRALTFFSPISGVVTAKNVVQGASVNAGDTPYEITDLGEVWVMADAYEGDLAAVHVGMPAALTLKAYPGRSFRGSVAFIDPLLDPATRTAKVHMHFSNPGLELKPEMYGDVVLEGRDRKGLRIPADAVIRSGTKDVVFIALGEGKFSPREVQLGARNGSEVEVRSGLESGQHVVTRANFLVDSESQLRASLAAMTEKKP